MPRPLAVTIVAWLYIAAGAGGIAYHLREFKTPVETEAIGGVLVCLVAIACGVFLLRAHNWARWLAVIWMAYHVVLSCFHSAVQVVVHALFLSAIAYFLFRPPAATEYFCGTKTRPA